MKRHRTQTRVQRIRNWSYDEAREALPYITSIVRSLREHRLDEASQQRAAERLDATPGRPDRDAIIAHEEALAEARRANERFEEALEELNTLDIYSLDPATGQALVPFAHGDELAWYIFDLFDGADLRFWRLHSDPLETRRPLAALSELPIETATV